MCGRYSVEWSSQHAAQRFRLDDTLDYPPRYNIAPSQVAPVIQQTAEGRRVVLLARWGLIPSWVTDPKMVKPINVKVETAGSGPMFRHAFRKQRILVPASGYYEWWATRGGEKQPYFIRMRDQRQFAIGGLLEHWSGAEGDVVSFAVMTTLANDLIDQIHARMPAIIAEADWPMWLDPSFTRVEALRPLLGPYPSDEMELYPVSKRVNRPTEDDAGLLERLQ